ncbi:MAG: TetR family transcriptional regulator [Clostridia bacterium]|nr:TetR family transcriptional regulator [Deltaproteobacteria bacterium]
MSIHKAERRSVILAAVIELLATKGIGGVTHRAADHAAGLPQGSSTYYFPKKSDLLRATAVHLAAELAKDCDELQIAFSDIVAKQGLDRAIDYVALQLVESLAQAKHLQLARIELMLAAARSDDLTDLATLLSVAGRRPIEFFVSLISNGQSQTAIDTCVGLIDGIALMYVTGQGAKPSAAQVATVLKSIVKTNDNTTLSRTD